MSGIFVPCHTTAHFALILFIGITIIIRIPYCPQLQPIQRPRLDGESQIHPATWKIKKSTA